MCSIEGCGNPVEARGLCRKHYGRWYRHGNPAAPDHRTSDFRPIGLCSVDGCERPHYAKGLCNNHYATARRPGLASYVCAACGSTFSAQRRGSGNRFCSRKCKERFWNASGNNRPTMRKYAFKAKYGLTIEDYERMRDAQGGCAICGRTEPIGRVSEHSQGFWLHVDHDHKSDRVRGLLCMECNTMLGKAQDDPGILRRAAVYLEM